MSLITSVIDLLGLFLHVLFQIFRFYRFDIFLVWICFAFINFIYRFMSIFRISVKGCIILTMRWNGALWILTMELQRGGLFGSMAIWPPLHPSLWSHFGASRHIKLRSFDYRLRTGRAIIIQNRLPAQDPLLEPLLSKFDILSALWLHLQRRMLLIS